MSYCYIGSFAMKQVLHVEECVDLDLIADYNTALSFLDAKNCRNIYPINQGKTLIGKNGREIIEISIAWPDSTNEELLNRIKAEDRMFADLNELYALKMSHRYLRNSPHFYKTMRDIRRMRNAGAVIPDDLKDWFKRREKETYNYKLPNLDQSKNNFFNGDGVTYVYDHDSIHEAVAFGHQPMYKNYQKDNSEVLCDKNKWEKLDQIDRLHAVAEECAVLALERSLIPFPGVKTEFEAFKFALMKVCTSITSGWFREFAWENHDDVLRLVMSKNYPYYNWFKEELAEGRVKSA